MQVIRESGTGNEVACVKFPTNLPFEGIRLEFEFARGRELFNWVVWAVELPSSDEKGGRLGSGNFVHDCWTT